jgi:DNA-directed RNA polymerase specialized sigma24 family protein
VLPTELEDHRRSGESTLLDALRARDPLALAEVYHRTIPAAHACARRLLSSSAQIEALLRTVYLELWEDPPKDVPLEAWIRRRCFALGVEDLRRRHAAPASPSAAMLLPDLPAPDVRYLDVVERTLSELDELERTVLLLAHDRGVDTAAQGDGAAEALDSALLALAGPETSSADVAALRSEGCPDGLWMGDWVLGLVDPSVAQKFEALIASQPGCAARARALRRGRRRLEGLPPAPDMGQRILVTVVSATQPLQTASTNGRDEVFWRADDAPTSSADNPGDVSTSELALEELLHEHTNDEVDRQVEPKPVRRPAEGVTITEPVTAVSVSMPDAANETSGLRTRRANPYAELVDLDDFEEDFELPDPHRVGPTAPVIVEPDPKEFESFFPEEELITRSLSTGQRVLVVIGYMLPVLLGAGLGLYFADLLFTR